MGDPAGKEARNGLIIAILTYILWGALPIYWKQLEGVHSLVVLCMRIVISVITVFVAISVTGEWRRTFVAETRSLLHNRKTLGSLIAASVFITVNWLVYIFAMEHSMILEASLGYFLLPMVNIVLAIFVLKERLSAAGWIASGLAFAGVVAFAVDAGVMP